MKRIIFLIGLAWLCVFADAQNNINQYEYWFDSDFTNRVTTNVTPTQLFILNSAVNASSLENGLHTFHIRFRDEDLNFSSVVSQFFQKINPNQGANAIAGFEYWFDNDYASKVSQTVTPQALYQLNTAISTNQLADGLHTFHVRFVDIGGYWSPTVSQFFQKINPNQGTNAIAGFEYWFDNDYAGKVSQTVTPQALYQLNTAISADHLENGLHTFHVRFVDIDGNWSPTVSQFFQKINPNQGANAIAGFEYWFDNDYANKVSQTVTPQTLYQLNSAINADQLENGLHKFQIRFQDTGGSWSSPVSQFFQKVVQGTGIPNVISSYRYWLDGDVNTMVNQTLTAPSNPLYLITYLNLAQVDTGEHQINLQFRDALGQWSAVVIDTFIKLGEPRLDYIIPGSAGNTGTVTVNLYGTGFYSGAQARLINPGIDTIMALSNSTVIMNGQRIQATFNLKNKSVGEYDVEVTIPGGIVLNLVDGFEVTEGTPIQLWSSIQGFNVIRPNQWQNYKVIVGNNGNVDATGVPFWISTPQNVEVDFDFPITNPYGNAYDYDTISNTFLTDAVWMTPSQSKMRSFVVAKIPPNQSRSYNFKIKSPGTSNFEIQSWINKPLYDEIQVLDYDPSECLHSLFEELIVGQQPPIIQCLYGAYDNIVTIWKDSPWGDLIGGAGTSNPDYGSIEYVLDYSRSVGSMALTCVEAAFNPVGDLQTIVNLVQGLNTISDLSQDCSGTLSTAFQVIRNSLTLVTSFDPNDKIGPSGAGVENYFNDFTPYDYVIHFENVDTATAKAQTVLVLDTLDATVFDYSTFQLSDLNIGDTVLTVPPGRKQYEVLYNMVAAQNVMVKITANFNDTTGVASWLFESLDPQTLTPVANPFDGFLPPNQDAPEGEGAVHYTVKLINNLPNNTLIKNKAYIYFDYNPPIVTEEWQNTLDNIKPHSQVDSLPPVEHNTSFNVSWNGIDTSSGIRDYNIYVSTNGGVYKHWLVNANFTSATFHGEVDSTYCFYSIATDSAGNIEAAPLAPDACTTISCPIDYILSKSPPNMDTVSASNTLTTFGAVTIASNYVVVFQAGTGITLAADFSVQLGADFTAYIEDCSAASMVKPSNSQEGLKINIFSADETELESLYSLTNGKVGINGNHIKGASYSVFNAMGRLVATGTIEDNQSINLSDEPAGLYLLFIEVENQTVFRKVIKE